MFYRALIMAIGERIKQRMAQLGWGRDGRRRLMMAVPGLTPQALSNLITRDSVRSEWDVAIARALGVSVLWLVYGDEAYPTKGNVKPLACAEPTSPILDRLLQVAAALPREDQAMVLGFASGLARHISEHAPAKNAAE